MTKADELFTLAQAIADERPSFFIKKGAGAGDHDTNSFMRELRSRETIRFGASYAEKKICGNNQLCVDFYFPEEATIVEIALSLRNPQSEFERDILKAVMAKKAGSKIDVLVFISKPGAIKRQSQPSSKVIVDWVAESPQIKVLVKEISNHHTS